MHWKQTEKCQCRIVNQSINQSINQCIDAWISQSINQSVSQSVWWIFPILPTFIGAPSTTQLLSQIFIHASFCWRNRRSIMSRNFAGCVQVLSMAWRTASDTAILMVSWAMIRSYSTTWGSFGDRVSYEGSFRSAAEDIKLWMDLSTPPTFMMGVQWGPGNVLQFAVKIPFFTTMRCPNHSCVTKNTCVGAITRKYMIDLPIVNFKKMHHCINQSINRSINQSIKQSINQSINQSSYQNKNLSLRRFLGLIVWFNSP